MALRKSPLGRVVETVATAFIVGNSIAFAMGAGPIEFPQYEFLPGDQQSVDALVKLHDDDPSNPEFATALGTLYFLSNRLDAAEEVTASIPEEFSDSPKVRLLNHLIAIKRSGESLDLWFGQVKLYQLNKLIDAIYQVSEEDDSLDTQLAVVATLSELTDVGNSEELGLKVAQRIEDQLTTMPEGALPIDLEASTYQALSNMYLIALKNTGDLEAFGSLAKNAVNKYDQLYSKIDAKSGWLEEGHQLVESRRKYLD